MLVVLAGTGAFLYVRLRSELDSSTEEALRSQVKRIEEVAREEAPGPSGKGGGELGEEGEKFAQILDSGGRILVSTPPLAAQRVLDPAELASARSQPTFSDHELSRPSDEDEIRVLASPVRTPKGRYIALAGESLDDRNEALDSLLTLLLIGGPVALLLASAAGYGVAAGAIRPVERMRRGAAEVSGVDPGRRLPVPPARDEIRALGETLNEMLGRLDRALERERGFVADASHELRTPLAILKTELELASESGRSAGELESAVRSAAEETERLVRLAEDLLVLARLDQGRLPLRSSEVRVSDLLDSVRERFEPQARDASRRIEAAAPQGLSIEGDRLRLEQALGNLVDNALRYGAGTITLTASESDGRLELHVVDEGAGFAPDFLPRAFQRFSRADEARALGGTGLGLSIVRAIAEAHGGGAEARNVSGSGADAWIWVPGGR